MKKLGGMAMGKVNHGALPSSLALAFLGDSVHSLYVRTKAVGMGLSRSKELHNKANEYVNAASQARLYEKIKDILTEDECDVFRRASNSGHLQKPKHMSAKDYRIATGFEAVLGMLKWLGEEERLNELLDAAHSGEDEIE
jgi:ribonuclease-3 family protein